MSLFKRFTFPMNHEPKRKSFEWIISEDKVLLSEEIKSLRKFCQKIKQKGIRKSRFCLIRDWFVIDLGLFS